MISGFFKKIQDGLAKTRTRLRDQLILTFTGRLIDESFWNDLEELLIVADVHFELAESLVRETRRRSERALIREPREVIPVLVEVITEHLHIEAPPLHLTPPAVYFFVGVNGTGKTTTIAKVAYWLKNQNKKVMLCAADTFRAAAIDQLKIWSERLQVPIIHHQAGGDPAAVLFDSLSAMKARGYDFLLVDTAGRLHTRTNLMKELEKMGRVARQHFDEAPHETFLVLDATTGQNALQQAKVFRDALPLTGLILTKLDGSARGGAVLTIVENLKIPIRFLGTGEKPEDLVVFNAEDFARALIGTPDELENNFADNHESP